MEEALKSNLSRRHNIQKPVGFQETLLSSIIIAIKIIK